MFFKKIYFSLLQINIVIFYLLDFFKKHKSIQKNYNSNIVILKLMEL